MSTPKIRKRSRSSDSQLAAENAPLPASDAAAAHGEEPAQSQSEYSVGYGRPPKHSQFKPGMSGNPRGRPKGSKCLATLIDEALNEKVTVVERGRERKLSRREIGARRVANKVAEGDPKMLAYLLKESGPLRGSKRGASPSPPPDSSLDAHEQSFMETLLEMAREAVDPIGVESDQ